MIYRLSNDMNPLHVDPTLKTGYPKPILHGLCTMGFVGQALWENLFLEDPMRLSELGIRFTGPVFPGDSLHLQAWQ